MSVLTLYVVYSNSEVFRKAVLFFNEIENNAIEPKYSGVVDQTLFRRTLD